MDLEIDMRNPTLPPPQDDALVVLAVCPRGQILEDVRAQVAAWPVAACVRWTADPIDALRIALLHPPTLVVVDARLDRAGGRALVSQLARWRADLEVFAFDDPPAEGLRAQPSLWHWSELPRVLRWWVRRHLEQLPRAPLFDSRPPPETEPLSRAA